MKVEDIVTVDEQLLYAVTPLFTDGDDGKICGTGFFLRLDQENVYLVTAAHVACEPSLFFELHVQDSNLVRRSTKKIAIETTHWHFHPSQDLAALRLREVKEGHSFFRAVLLPNATDEQLRVIFPALVNVIMAGYPNRIWDENHGLPLLRSGSTSTHPGLDFNGTPEGRLNLTALPADSGAPVFSHSQFPNQKSLVALALGKAVTIPDFLLLGVHIGAEERAPGISRYVKAKELITISTWQRPSIQKRKEVMNLRGILHRSGELMPAPLVRPKPMFSKSPVTQATAENQQTSDRWQRRIARAKRQCETDHDAVALMLAVRRVESFGPDRAIPLLFVGPDRCQVEWPDAMMIVFPEKAPVLFRKSPEGDYKHAMLSDFCPPGAGDVDEPESDSEDSADSS